MSTHMQSTLQRMVAIRKVEYYVTNSGPKDYACGLTGSTKLLFFLDHDAPCEGYLVQKIEVYCMVDKGCKNGQCNCPVLTLDRQP